MKCFEEKMSYPQFLKYLVPSVLTMIFLSFYTFDGTCNSVRICDIFRSCSDVI